MLINDVVQKLNFSKFFVFSKFLMFNNNVKNSSSKINKFNVRFSIQKKIEIFHRVSNFFERFYVFVIQNDILIALFIDRVKKKFFLFDLQFAFQ